MSTIYTLKINPKDESSVVSYTETERIDPGSQAHHITGGEAVRVVIALLEELALGGRVTKARVVERAYGIQDPRGGNSPKAQRVKLILRDLEARLSGSETVLSASARGLSLAMSHTRFQARADMLKPIRSAVQSRNIAAYGIPKGTDHKMITSRRKITS